MLWISVVPPHPSTRRVVGFVRPGCSLPYSGRGRTVPTDLGEKIDGCGPRLWIHAARRESGHECVVLQPLEEPHEAEKQDRRSEHGYSRGQ